MRFYLGNAARLVREQAGAPAIIEGLVVPFTEPSADGAEFQGVDLFRTFFNSETNYYLGAGFNVVRSFYRHMQDSTLADRLLGVSTLQVRDANGDDPAGVWAETQLAMADNYDAKILEMVKAGKMRQSSAAGESMYEVKPVKIGKRELGYVSRWGIIENSLTPTPATPLVTGAMARTLTQREFANLFHAKTALGRRRGVPVPDENTEDDSFALDLSNPYEAALADFTPSRWQLEDLLCKLIRQVAMMAKMAATTGAAYDYEAQVAAIMAGYARVFGQSINGQIEDYIEAPADEYGDDYFYLRSLLIDDTTLENHTRALESGLLDVMNRFRGRRDNRGANRGLSNADIARLAALRSTLERGIAEAGRLSLGGVEPPAEEFISEEAARELRKKALKALV